jgi:nucleoside-diphosphate-sugar epimerase
MVTALVLGAGGFIGSHLVKRLKNDGYWVRGVDLKHPEFNKSKADEFIIGDLRDPDVVKKVLKLPQHLQSDKNSFDEIYQLAAEMGGAGYIFIGDNDASIMHNSALINLNVAKYSIKHNIKKLFFSSSACVYPKRYQTETKDPNLSEKSAYPANPDSEYGWEKLFSERVYLTFHRNYDLNVRIGRFHNIFGPEGTWHGGKEKAPAALCRKVAQAENGEEIEVWGDGEQTRSFLYIDECLEGIRRFMDSNFTGPLNIGSDEMISIQNLAKMIIDISGKRLTIKNVKGPTGVRARNSDNRLIKEKLNWTPSMPLRAGMEKTYNWINSQVMLKEKKVMKSKSKITP